MVNVLLLSKTEINFTQIFEVTELTWREIEQTHNSTGGSSVTGITNRKCIPIIYTQRGAHTHTHMHMSLYMKMPLNTTIQVR